jgi:hypothetical protein
MISPLADRNRTIGESEFAILGRHERLARHALGRRVEHTRVQHFPGADLLLYHLLTGGCRIHIGSARVRVI